MSGANYFLPCIGFGVELVEVAEFCLSVTASEDVHRVVVTNSRVTIPWRRWDIISDYLSPFLRFYTS